jgi:hypothetical protein
LRFLEKRKKYYFQDQVEIYLYILYLAKVKHKCEMIYHLPISVSFVMSIFDMMECIIEYMEQYMTSKT